MHLKMPINRLIYYIFLAYDIGGFIFTEEDTLRPINQFQRVNKCHASKECHNSPSLMGRINVVKCSRRK